MVKCLEHLNPYSPEEDTGIDRELWVAPSPTHPKEKGGGAHLSPSLVRKGVSTRPCRQLDVCPHNWGLQ